MPLQPAGAVASVAVVADGGRPATLGVVAWCWHPTVAGAPRLSAGAWTRLAGSMAACGWLRWGLALAWRRGDGRGCALTVRLQ